MSPFRRVDDGLNCQHPVWRGGDSRGIVEMQGSTARGGVVVVGFIQCRPGGVVAVGEGAVGDVEFVGHDKFVLGAVDERGGFVQGFGGVFVDPGALYRAEE